MDLRNSARGKTPCLLADFREKIFTLWSFVVKESFAYENEEDAI